LLGFGLASGLLLLLGWGYLQCGLYTLREPAPWASVVEPLVSAVSVSVLEEVLFRGLVLGLLLRSLSIRWACLVCTALFAAVHFLKPPEDFTVAETVVHAGSGFSLVAVILGNFLNVHFFFAEFLTLFAVGLALVYARIRTGALWLSIGLHTGWVFGLKWFSALTLTTKWLRRGQYLPWVGENLKVGLCSLLVISATGVLAVWLSRHFIKQDE
jgi:membrane protease YdiL (CAAX protease family)